MRTGAWGACLGRPGSGGCVGRYDAIRRMYAMTYQRNVTADNDNYGGWNRPHGAVLTAHALERTCELNVFTVNVPVQNYL